MKKILTTLLSILLLCAIICVLPAQAEAATAVSGVHIFIDEPAIGEKPDYAFSVPIADSKQYRYHDAAGHKMGGAWKNVEYTDFVDPNGEYVFKPDTKYVYELLLQPQSGYYFTEATKVQLNGEDCNWEFLDGTSGVIKLTKNFSTPQGTRVPKFEITVTPPVAGQKPVYTSRFPATDKAKPYLKEYGYNYKLGIKWMDVTTDTEIDPDSEYVFEKGHVYRVYVIAAPQDGYQIFPKDTYTDYSVLTINGNDVEWSGYDDVDSVMLYELNYTFPAAQYPVVDKIAITDIQEPQAGQQLDNSFTLPEDALYEIESYYWYDLTNHVQVTDANHIAQPGVSYRLNIYLKPVNATFKFSENNTAVTGTMNGKAAQMTTVYGDDPAERVVAYYTYDELPITYVTQVAVEDIDVPVAGAKPDYTCKWASNKYAVATTYQDIESKIGVVWFNDSKGYRMIYGQSVFEPGDTYRVRVFLKTQADGVFQTNGSLPNVSATINGKTATTGTVVGKSASNMIAIDYIFPKVPLPEVTQVAVTDVEAPVAGAAPDTELTVPENCGYKIIDVEWKDVTNSTSVGGTFQEGNKYQVRVYLKAGETALFKAEGVTGTVNGQHGTILPVLGSSYKEQLCLTYTFPAAPAAPDKPITGTVVVQIKEPSVGASPDYNAVVPGIQDYQLRDVTDATLTNGVCWLDLSAGTMLKAGDTFQAGHQYSVLICLEPKDGFDFSTDTEGKANVPAKINLIDGDVTGTADQIAVSAEFAKLPGKGVDVLFTADSSKLKGKTMTVDIEAMAETDEILMAAYLSEGVTYQWYKDGLFTGDTGVSLHLDNSWAGKSIYVKVFYSDKISVSESFVVEDVCSVHTYGEWIETKAATCTAKGEKERQCTVCGEKETAEIGLQSHTASDWKSDKITHWKECTVCGKEMPTSREAHNFGKDNICDICGHDKTIPHTHSLTAVAAKDATCTDAGNKAYYTCACGKWFSNAEATVEILDKDSVVIPAKGHTESGWKNDETDHWKDCTVCATEISGSKAAHDFGSDNVCDTCGYDKTIPHTHSLTAVAAKNATCTDAGNEAYYTCACGKWFSNAEATVEILDKDSVVIPAKGHTESGWKNDETNHWKDCTVCATEISGSKAAHNFGADNVCDDCGYTKSQPPVGTKTVSRIFGSNRCATARKVADAMKEELNVEKFDAILYTSSLNFADALAGSYLSAVKTAPILLYLENKTDPQANLDYIQNNLAPGGTVYILGGPVAVPASVETALDGIGVAHKRLAGAQRFQTNIEILKESGFSGGTVLVCTAMTFADSLSASATGLPILLVYNKWTDLSDEYKAYLSNFTNLNFVIVGGDNAVHPDMATALKAYGTVETRLAGKTRYETSIMVAEKFFTNPDEAVLAYALNFPDGLCGGALAYVKKAPLVLTNTGATNAATAYAAAKSITAGAVLGGEGLIDDASVRTVFAMTESAPIYVK